MRRAINKTLLASSIVLALGSQAAFATNGIAPTGLGMEHRAMGGAAAGYAANTTSMATNPASASFIKDGYDVGFEVFKPNRSATEKATGKKANGNGDELFLIPEAGYKRQINDKVAAGVVVYGNGGMNTAYDSGVSFGAGSFGGAPGTPTGIDLKQVFVAPTVSYKISDNAAVGVSANLVQQRLEVEGLAAFGGFSTDPTKISGNGGDSSTGIGATLGIQGKLSDKLSVGLAHRTKVSMGKLDKYAGLLPNNGEMDVPAATTVGIAYQATPKTLIAADIQQIEYSGIDATGNLPSAGAFGDKAGFGWSDQTIYKLGVKHQVNDKLAVMAGVNHGKNPVDAKWTTVNVLAPAIVENHVSLGVERKLTPKSKIIGSYVHAFGNTLKGNGTGMMDAYDLKMDQDAVGVAYSVEF